MAMLLLRSLGLLLLFQLLAVAVVVAGRRGRALQVAAMLLVALAGASLALRSADPGLFLASAVLAGLLVERAVRARRGVWAAAAAGLVPVVLAAVVGLLGRDPQRSLTELRRQVEEISGAASVAPPAAGPKSPEEQRVLEQTQQLATAAARWAMRLLPAEIVGMGLLQVLLVVVAAGRAARAAGFVPAVLPVAHWQVPFASVWALALGLALAATRHPAGIVTGCNLVLLVATWLAVQGFAVTLALLERTVPPRARGLLLVLAVLVAWPLFVGGLALLGTADLWVDFRRLRHPADDS